MRAFEGIMRVLRGYYEGITMRVSTNCGESRITSTTEMIRVAVPFKGGCPLSVAMIVY